MGTQKKKLETPERPIGKTDEGIGVFFMIDRNPGLAIDFCPRKARKARYKDYEENRKGKTERGKSRSYERFSSRSLSSFCFSQLVLSSKT